MTPRGKVPDVDRVDKTSPVALTDQLYAVLRAAIEAGEYPPGELLPGERRLRDYHNVARITVQRALRLLERQDYIVPAAQRGWIVKRREDWRPPPGQSALEDTL